MREEHCLVCYSAVYSSKGAITDDPTAFIFYTDGSKSFCETVVLFYQITWRYIQEDCNGDENITSHKMQEVPLFENMSSTKHSNKCVCQLK